MQAQVYKDNRLIAGDIRVAGTYLSRLVGLLGQRKLEPGKGLLLTPCKQIHTCFMSIDIDVIFLNNQGQIIKSIADMKPWKKSPRVSGCCQVLEMAAGFLAEYELKEGMVLRVD